MFVQRWRFVCGVTKHSVLCRWRTPHMYGWEQQLCPQVIHQHHRGLWVTSSWSYVSQLLWTRIKILCFVAHLEVQGGKLPKKMPGDKNSLHKTFDRVVPWSCVNCMLHFTQVVFCNLPFAPNFAKHNYFIDHAYYNSFILNLQTWVSLLILRLYSCTMRQVILCWGNRTSTLYLPSIRQSQSISFLDLVMVLCHTSMEKLLPWQFLRMGHFVR